MARTLGGTVTLLFTDVVRSTEVLQTLGDDQYEVLRREHFNMLREAVAGRAGQEVKTVGDGIMAVFRSVVDALACAVAMQQTVDRRNQQQPEDRRLGVRVGLHAGEPIRHEEDYFGTPVVVAGRLCDRARGGQILASELVRGLAGSRGGYSFRGVGALDLKGIAEPLPACEVLWEPAGEGVLPLPPLVASGERTTFVGRQLELAQLRRDWERARDGQRRLVFLVGEAGIGKTRLAAEFALVAHAEGAAVLFGRAGEEALIAYQPFVEALRHYVGACPVEDLRERLGTSGGELARLVPELAHRLPDLVQSTSAGTEGERYHLFEAVMALLAAVSSRAPTVLVLDDLHWADEATLLLLKHIARSPERLRLLILGNYRETDVDRAHPLWETLADLRRDRAFERLAVKGLDEGGVGELIDDRAGHEAPPAFVRAVHEQTEGNPFFIEEVLRHLLETGAIYEQDGRLTTERAVSQLGIPEGVKDVIGRRLSRLSDGCNSVLTVASVIGREFGLDALERASDLSGDRLAELLEEAVAARVVEEEPETVGRYSFSHTLIHEALYDELTTTRRVRLHGQTLQYADSNGAKLAYEVLGSAGPYVIAVGLGNCPAVRGRNRDVARHWERCSRHCRVILYDRRGTGFSAAPERGYSLLASVEDIRAVLDAVGAEKAVLWGATDGGPLAIAFAARYAERAAGLLLLGTTAKYTNAEDFSLGVNPNAIEIFQRTDPLDHGRAVSELFAERRPPSSSSEAAAVAEVVRRVPPEVWPKVMGGIGSADARKLLRKVRAPTLVMHDPPNTYIPVEAAYYLHENIPNSRLEIMDEYGIYPLGGRAFHTAESFIRDVTTRSAR